MKNASKSFAIGTSPLDSSTKGYKKFIEVYGFIPDRIFDTTNKENVIPRMQFTFWSDYKRIPLHIKNGEERPTMQDRASFFKNLIDGSNPSIQDNLSIFSFPVGVASEKEYNAGSRVLHPTGISWTYYGSSCLDREDNETPEYNPFFAEITNPASRWELWKIWKNEGRLPRISDFSPVGDRYWKGGVYQPFSGFILFDGLYEGFNPGPVKRGLMSNL